MKNSYKFQSQNSNQIKNATVKSRRVAIAMAFLLGISQIAHGQWTRIAPKVYLTAVTDKVGIGTTAPTQKLDVNGDAVFNGIRVGRGNGGMSNNTIIGTGALNSNTAGNGNTASGYQALYSNTIGNYNTATGRSALSFNISGIWNTANGYQSLYHNITGNYNVASGGGVLYYNTSGWYNTASGYEALFHNTTGSGNTANGKAALYNNTTGRDNIANGFEALSSNTTGFWNTANGSGALSSNTIGNGNTANGYQSLYHNTTGASNTANGYPALEFNSTGSANTANGNYALDMNTTGNGNTAVGVQALFSNTAGSYNTAIGSNADVGSENLVFATAIGADAVVTSSNRMQLGSSTAIVSTSNGYSIVSDGRFKDEVKTEDAPGLSFINKLRPVAYYFNYKRYDDFLRRDIKATKGIEVIKTNIDEYQRQLAEKSKQRQIGFIAQEVDQMCRDNKFIFNGVYAPQNGSDNYALDYSRFVVPLVKAVQELDKKTERIDKLENEIKELKEMVQQLIQTKSINGTNGYLSQNVPNPYRNGTIINYYVPDNADQAQIIVTDSKGSMIKSFTIPKGQGQLNINGGELAAGIYNYTLYFNNKKAGSKEMIITR